MTALLLTVVGVLRSGSLVGSARDQRREYRGRKWYDGMQLLVAAPWHLVQSIAATVLLALWSLGLAVAAALVCYAFSTGPRARAVRVRRGAGRLALWMGPGGSRVRGPVSRVVNLLAASVRGWVVAMLVVLAAALVLGCWPTRRRGLGARRWPGRRRLSCRPGPGRCPGGRRAGRRAVHRAGAPRGRPSVVVTAIRRGRRAGARSSHDAVRPAPSTVTEAT